MDEILAIASSLDDLPGGPVHVFGLVAGTGVPTGDGVGLFHDPVDFHQFGI